MTVLFNGGFLAGIDFYNYRQVSAALNPELYHWRSRMYVICERFDIAPEVVCVAFGRNAPGVKSVALNTTDVSRVRQNIEMVRFNVPKELWFRMVAEGLIDSAYAEKYLLA